ncbi:MAG: hypothetical protein JWR77_1138 [Rhizorhabdus sp.]|nr:hypothetical protein [Rhizorhabdus sp.]
MTDLGWVHQMEVAVVQIVENHAEITGDLLSVVPDPERPGFVRLTVHVTEARPVGEFPNMFAYDRGQTIEVIARAGNHAAGAVMLRVKKTGPGVSFVEE